MKVVIYARYSKGSGQTYASIEGQLKVCHDFARNNDHTIIGEYIDEAITGKTDKRPEFQRMLRDSIDGQFRGVLVYQLDRMGRNILQALQNEEKLKKSGVEVISANEPIANTPSGRFMRHIQMANNQYYSEELALKIKRGMDLKAARCLFTGGGIALGFKVNPDKTIGLDETAAQYVKKIFEMYASGKNMTQINAYLNGQGVRTSTGGVFNKNSLTTLLQNKRYLGIFTWKGQDDIPDGVPRIISDELFEKVRLKMIANKKAPARARALEEYILTGKLFCGHCKTAMVGISGTSKTGTMHLYYNCQKQRQKKCCKKAVKKRWLEDKVIEIIKRILDEEDIDGMVDELFAACDKEKETLGLKHLEKQIKENERKTANLNQAVAECDMPEVRKGLYTQLNELQIMKLELEKQLAIESNKWQFPMKPTEVKFFFRKLQKADITKLSVRKSLITVLVSRIELFDDGTATFIINAGDKPVTITEKLLEEVESNLGQSSYIDCSSPPNFVKREPYAYLIFNDGNIGILITL